MMAAGTAAEKGARVFLLEKNEKLGKKLLLTGKGRCNLTNKELNPHEFINKLGERGDFFYSAFCEFGPKETMRFFEKRGLDLKTERGNRVFPKSDKAEDVLSFFKNYLKENKVKVKTNCKVSGLIEEGDKIKTAKTGKGKMEGDAFILAAGGKSYPGTGSSGEAFGWVENLGHTITKLRPSLVPLVCKEKWVKELQGLDLKNVNLTVLLNDEEKEEIFGDMLFTHFGVSGPIVLEASRRITDFLRKGKVELMIDLKPALSFEKLDKRLVRDFQKYQRSMFKNSLGDLLPSKIIPLIVQKSGIKAEKRVHDITREERHELLHLLKNLKVTVKDTLGFKQAIITKGGVLTDEVSQKTMRSKIIKNLYFAGEVLDLDGPTGGYNLQIAWTTARIAGKSALRGTSASLPTQ